MSLDPDSPRPPYQQVASSLRAAILTKKFKPGEKLPSQTHLAKHYEVARMTVQQALRVLRDEGLIVSRQGSGVFVRERTSRPVALRPHLEAAFTADRVKIDFCGFTAETLHGSLAEPLDRVRDGRLTPDSIEIRLLLPDMNAPIALPSLAKGSPVDSAKVRNRVSVITERHTGALENTVNELLDLGLISAGSVKVKYHASSPLFKAYLINETEAFFGFYPVLEHEVRIEKKKTMIYDPMGKDAMLFHYAQDDETERQESHFIEQITIWFDSVWNTVAHEESK